MVVMVAVGSWSLVHVSKVGIVCVFYGINLIFGGHGTTAAAMVYHVLSIYVSFVLELYVKYTFPPNKIFYCSQAIYPTHS